MKSYIWLTDSHKKHESSQIPYKVVLPPTYFGTFALALLWQFCLGFPPNAPNDICVSICFGV